MKLSFLFYIAVRFGCIHCKSLPSKVPANVMGKLYNKPTDILLGLPAALDDKPSTQHKHRIIGDCRSP